MNGKLSALSRRYEAALRKHLKHGPRASLHLARDLGLQAVALGLETLDVVRIHEGALALCQADRSRNGVILRGGVFFAEVIIPIENTHRAALEANARLTQVNKTLGRRTGNLKAANQLLKQGIARRKAVEKALEESGGNKRAAAKGLRISPGTLYSLMKRHRIFG